VISVAPPGVATERGEDPAVGGSKAGRREVVSKTTMMTSTRSEGGDDAGAQPSHRCLLLL
jgi:hypothetical protein